MIFFEIYDKVAPVPVPLGSYKAPGRETDRLQATIRELQERMQADVAEFQFQVSANKTRQVAFTATLREQQERLAAREAEAARLRGAVGERDALVRELQGRLEETEERLRGLKAELQASASQVAAAEFVLLLRPNRFC